MSNFLDRAVCDRCGRAARFHGFAMHLCWACYGVWMSGQIQSAAHCTCDASLCQMAVEDSTEAFDSQGQLELF